MNNKSKVETPIIQVVETKENEKPKRGRPMGSTNSIQNNVKVKPKKRIQKTNVKKALPLTKEVASKPIILDIKKNKWSDIKKLDISKVEQVEYPDNKYFKEEIDKNQIIIHHTGSGYGVTSDIDSFINNKTSLSSNFIINRNGIIYQLFDSKYWSHNIRNQGIVYYNLGFSDNITRNKLLNQHSISIELDNWGGLNKISDFKYTTEYGNIVTIDKKNIINYSNKFKKHEYYEKYTLKQLESLGELLLYLGNTHNIPLIYNSDKIFNVNMKALSGESGVWTHTSYSEDVSDCHPDPNLISLLKTIDSLK